MGISQPAVDGIACYHCEYCGDHQDVFYSLYEEKGLTLSELRSLSN